MITITVPQVYTLPTIDFVGGATQELSFHLYFRDAKKPFDVSDCEANFAIINYINKNSQPAIAKQMSISESGEADSDGFVQNIFTVTISPEDTVDLAGKFIYQITIKDSGGDVEIPNQGIMFISNNIHKSYIK